MLKAGDKAPRFTLQAASGTEVSLADLRGKTVILYFYPKDMTPGCTQEACDFSGLSARFKKKGVVVLGVSRDSVESHKKFVAKNALNIDLLSDEKGQVCKAFGAWRKKKLYGREFMGIVRSTFVIGPDGRIREVYDSVKVKGHAEEILDAVAGAGSAR